MPRILFFFFVILSFSTLLSAQVELSNEQDSYTIGKSISYLKDPTASLNLEDILSKQELFTPSNQENLNFGFTSDVIWVKCVVDNQSDFDDWILNLNLHVINYFDFYYQDETGWKKTATGNALAFNTKQIESATFAFFLNVAPKSEKTYYFRFKTENFLILPLRIQRTECFNRHRSLRSLYYGGYFGILLVMILYNLFIYLTLKDKNYLYYVLTIVSTLALFSSTSGYTFMLLWADTPALNVLPTRIFISLAVITTAVFTIHFLELKKHSRLLYYLMFFNIFLAVLASVLHQFTSLKSLTNNVISGHVLILILSGIVSWKKGNSLAKYYLFAWSFYMLGGLIIVLRNNGILPSTLFTGHAVEIGSILEVIIISFALSEKYRLYKQEKEIANKRALEIQQQANEELENKVQERTSELQATLELVSKQNIDIESKNKNTDASIAYASRIQGAFLAISTEVKKVLPKHFIFFKPRDVVSGDFYFFAQKENKIIIAVVDCTGHGIPGAMMAMMGEAYLGQIIQTNQVLDAGEILLEMHQKICSALLQDDDDYAIQDGMDMALCIIDEENKVLEFAGAKRPLIYIQNNEIHQIAGSKLSIGGSKRERGAFESFEKHLLPIESELAVYLFTDGFQDQFGGDKNKKFMSRNFKNLLLENHQKPLEEQKEILDNAFSDWKGEGKQIDDVLVIGFRIGKDF